jgi:hypothetical protein
MLSAITSIAYAVTVGFAVAVTLGFLFPVIPPDITTGIGLALAADIIVRRQLRRDA